MKLRKQKLVRLIVGTTILVVGLIAGIALVMQPQLFNQQAAALPPCPPSPPYACSSQPLENGTKCRNTEGNGTDYYNYCCPRGTTANRYTIIDGRCVIPPKATPRPTPLSDCGKGLDCRTTSIQRSNRCKQPGTGKVLYCCSPGQYVNGNVCK